MNANTGGILYKLKIDHVSKFWISSLFLVRKFCISSKFEEKLNLRQKSIFEQEFNKKLNGSNFELIQNLMHIPSREKIRSRVIDIHIRTYGQF